MSRDGFSVVRAPNHNLRSDLRLHHSSDVT